MAGDKSLGFYVLVDADTRKASAKVGSFAADMHKKVSAAVKALPDIKIDANSSAAQRRIADIRKELASLSDKRVGVDIDAGEAQARIARLSDELRRLGATSRSVQVQADTRAALTALGEVDRRATRLDGRNVTMTARVDGQQALTMLGLITGGLSTVGVLAPAAAGALAAMPAAAGVAAQGVAALTVGLNGVGDAVKALTDAEHDLALGGEAARKAQQKLDEELRHLSPAARDFAESLAGEVLPALRGVRDGVQATMLPRLQVSVENLTRLTPEFTEGLSETGRVIGDLAVQGSAMMTTGPWRDDFRAIMAGNNRALGDFGAAGLDVLDAMRSLTVAGLPLVERFAEATARSAELFNTWVQGARESGELDVFLRQAGDSLAELGENAAQVIGGIVRLTLALAPLGSVLLDTVAVVAQLVGDFASAYPTLTQFAAGAILASTAVVKLGTTIAGAHAAAGVATGGIALLGKGVANLMPAALSTALAARFETVASSTGVLTERLTGNAAAGNRVAATGSRVGGALAAVGGMLPAVAVAAGGLAIAYDGLTTSSGEAAAAMAQGGQAAQEALEGLAVQTALAELPLLGKGFDLVTTDLAEFREGLHGVELAQFEAAVAANNHGEAVKRFGVNSPEAVAAQAVLADSVDRVEQEQTAAKLATESHTDALIRQRDTMLGSLDAEIAWEAAIDNLTESVAKHGATLDLSTEGGRSNATALNEMARAADTDAVAKANNGATTAELTALTAHHREALYRAALQTGMNTTEARNYVNQLNLTPKTVFTRAELDTERATHALNTWIRNNNGREVTVVASMRTPTGQSIRQLGGGAAGAVVQPMAAGGMLSNRVAQRVPANTPRLIGDRMRGAEYFLPDDSSPRSLAIGTRWAGDRGMRLVPMAAGGVLHGGTAMSMWRGTGGAPGMPGLPTDPAAVTELTEAVKGLIGDALEPMAARLSGETVPALLTALEHYRGLATGVDTASLDMTTSTTTLQAAIDAAWANMTATTGAKVAETRDVHLLALANAHRAAEASQTFMRDTSNAAWFNMATVTGQQVGHITGPVFGGLHAGMSSVNQHGVTMADGWAIQLSRLRAAAADPIRWVMQFPLGPPGLAASWNRLDDQFKLGKRITPPAPGFATGGPIRGPGTGTSDQVPIMASTGEFIVREQVASRVGHFLEALNAAQPEAIQAAGGTGGQMPGYAAGGLIAAQQWARAQHGKPYIWGGVGPQGYDCSGFMSAITNVLRGQGPHRRLGVARSQPWGGFGPGLRGAFATGYSTGHTAGTLGGVNVEAGGSPSRTKYAAGAAGADHRQFPRHAYLPEVGGVFASGGAGGGAGIDPAPIVNAAFKRTYELVADVTRFFVESAHVLGTQGVARHTVDAIKAKAMAAVAAKVGAGGLGPVGAGAPFYVGEISRAARSHGLNIDAATIGTATSLVETNLRNLANRAVPESLNFPNDGLGGDHDSIGLFQQRQAGWGTTAQRMNPFASAGMFFDRLRRFDWRSMEPGAAAQRVQRSAFPGRYSGRMGQARGLVGAHGGFDAGGYAAGAGIMAKSVISAERVLSPRQTEAFERLVRVLDNPRRAPAVDPGALAAAVATATGRAVTQAMSGDGLRIRIEDDGRNGMAWIVRRQERALKRQ